MSTVCRCGKGYASQVDNLCCFCREKKYSRKECKKVGVRYRGDGLTLDQERTLLGKVNFPPIIK